MISWIPKEVMSRVLGKVSDRVDYLFLVIWSC